MTLQDFDGIFVTTVVRCSLWIRFEIKRSAVVGSIYRRLRFADSFFTLSPVSLMPTTAVLPTAVLQGTSNEVVPDYCWLDGLSSFLVDTTTN